MSCIICQDGTSEKVIKNKYCDCKYYFHKSCWNIYIKSTPNNVKCLLCRKNLTKLFEPNSKTIPSAPPPDIIVEHEYRELENQEHEQELPHQNIQNDDRKKKIAKIIITLAIIIVITIVFISII